MLYFKAVQYKALFLLVVFAANFFVVCHCQASMKASMARAEMHGMGHHSCCEGMHGNALMDEAGGAKGEKGVAAGAHEHPCDGNSCNHTQAVRFQLLEKQVADQVSQPAVFITFTINHFILDSIAVPSLTGGDRFRIDQWPGTYQPPDLQALYQSFLI